MKEVFKINEGEYNKENSYWKSFSIIDQIKKTKTSNKELFEKIDKIKLFYKELSFRYQDSKISNNIPLK